MSVRAWGERPDACPRWGKRRRKGQSGPFGRTIADLTDHISLSLFFFLTVHAAAMSSFVATAGRARFAAATATARTALKPRCFATSLRRQDEQKSAPKPPPTIDDSTSALDYKRTMRHRPPPLPAMDLMRSRTAEEAVTNILYNTPPPSLAPAGRT